MDTFSPDFSQYWFADRSNGGNSFAAAEGDDETLSESQQDALAALADRVNAARSVM
jgi:hypothetical protein